MPRARLAALVALIALLPGCALPWSGGDGGGTPSTPIVSPTQVGPPLVFAGRVVDALTGAPLDAAEVRLDLAQTRPCRTQGLLWTSWPLLVDADGAFGPFEVQRPRSDDVAFFVHAAAPGHTERSTYVGPGEARDASNLTLRLYPAADVDVRAPPGTVVALEDDETVRVAVADESGAARFEGARPVPSAFVAATDVPYSESVTAPADVAVPEANGTSWRLEGRVQLRTGAPIAADLLAWNGSMLVSAARAGDNGVFVLPLRAEAVEQLYVFARTATGQYGATKVLQIEGPPGTRQTLIMEALC